MTKIRQRMYLLAFAALVLVFSACKGESPTAPTATPGGGTGGVTPPATASLTVTVSNATPLVDSTTVVTATVTVDGKPAPNGTAVEFTTTLGTFIDVNGPLTIRTTTDGVATVTLTSSIVGTAKITATVANVSKTAQATFSLKPTTPTPPDTTATITSISPTFGRPAGGEIITINGKNFTAPVRVLFDYGAGTTSKEAQVVSVSATQIQVISPPIDLGTAQTKDATIIVINNVGSPNEARITGPIFTYQAQVLTPKITTISPASGPIDGGTRVTIFGEGFQAPVQVFFGSAEAQVINVTFSQIIVMSPTARDTAPGGSGSVTGPVDVKIINVNSATTVIATGIFRYTPKMQITAMGPTEGLFTGGTRVTIDGIGFNDPVAVVIGGVAAQPIKVTGTQIIAITSGVVPTSCADVTGPTTVTNVDNGDTATGPSFVYRVPKAIILGVTPNPVAAGGSIQVRVANAYGFPRLSIGDTSLGVTASSTDPLTEITTFTASVPSGETALTYATQVCPAGGATGSIPVPTNFDLKYESATTGCTDTLTKGIQVIPPAIPKVTVPQQTAIIAKITPATPASAGPPPVLAIPASVAPGQGSALIGSVGSVPLRVTAVALSSSCSPRFVLTVPPLPVDVASCDLFGVGITYQGLTTAGSETCIVSFTTNAGGVTTVKNVTVTGTSQ